MFDKASVPVFNNCIRNLLIIQCNCFLIAVFDLIKGKFFKFLNFIEVICTPLLRPDSEVASN